MSDEDLRTSALLSVQRALLGAVTPDLRAVAVSWGDKAVQARFIFDRELDVDTNELTSVAETEVIADFYDDMTVSFEAEYLPEAQPVTVRPGESLAFLRSPR